MPLSDDDKKRIEEEEIFRASVRRKLAHASKRSSSGQATAPVLIASARELWPLALGGLVALVSVVLGARMGWEDAIGERGNVLLFIMWLVVTAPLAMVLANLWHWRASNEAMASILFRVRWVLIAGFIFLLEFGVGYAWAWFTE